MGIMKTRDYYVNTFRRGANENKRAGDCESGPKHPPKLTAQYCNLSASDAKYGIRPFLHIVYLDTTFFVISGTQISARRRVLSGLLPPSPLSFFISHSPFILPSSLLFIFSPRFHIGPLSSYSLPVLFYSRVEDRARFYIAFSFFLSFLYFPRSLVHGERKYVHVRRDGYCARQTAVLYFYGGAGAKQTRDLNLFTRARARSLAEHNSSTRRAQCVIHGNFIAYHTTTLLPSLSLCRYLVATVSTRVHLVI